MSLQRILKSWKNWKRQNLKQSFQMQYLDLVEVLRATQLFYKRDLPKDKSSSTLATTRWRSSGLATSRRRSKRPPRPPSCPPATPSPRPTPCRCARPPSSSPSTSRPRTPSRAPRRGL